MSSFVRWMAEVLFDEFGSLRCSNNHVGQFQGAYEGKITVTDSTGSQLACIAVTLEVAQ